MTSQLNEQVYARYHECDPYNRVRLPVILAWLQEAGAEHARQLGVGLQDLGKLGLTWVLSRITLALERPIIGPEPITVTTWPVNRDGLFSVRDFRLTTRSGLQVGCATSSWAALNLKSRRPVKIADHLPPYPLWPERALEDPFATLPTFEVCQSALKLPVLRADLDQNQHVNNTVYASWAMESVPEELMQHAFPALVEIGFRSEALYGDQIRSFCSRIADDPPVLLHRIESATTGTELCRLRTRWLPAT